MNTNEQRFRASRRMSRRQALKLVGLGFGATAGGSFLAACAPPATTAPATSVPATSAPATAASVTLRYQNHWTKETDAHYQGMVWLYEEFGKAHPEVVINNVLNPDSQASHQKIMADCAANDCPDIVQNATPEQWTAGYLLDLAPYLDADPAWKSIMIPDLFFRTGDHIWGLCAQYSPMPTIWNTRILDAAGVGGAPTTWDELLDTCDKVKASGKMPTSWGVGGAHIWHNIVASLAGGLDALAANQFDAPQIREAFERMKVFVDNGWIPQNEIELTWQQSIGQFVAEETAFYLNGSWTINNEITGAGAAPDLKDHVHFTSFPAVGPNGSALEMKNNAAIALSRAVGDNPAKLEGALKFLKFWFSREGARQWVPLTSTFMGIDIDVNSVTGVNPLVTAFLGAQGRADLVYTLPNTQAMLERGWDDSWSGLQTLMVGGSADEAHEAFITEMSKYRG
jgi:raffinose/stachyose/melibiose transport system substrate-binding protein